MGNGALVPADVIANSGFRSACLTILFLSAVFFSAILYVPQLMEKVLGYSALEAGVGDARGLTDWLCERFDVTPEEAGAEVARLLAELEERGLVTAAATS